ncbi:MAG: calcium/sodium antiporter [Candidatus Nanoarchaeia archaeon]
MGRRKKRRKQSKGLEGAFLAITAIVILIALLLISTAFDGTGQILFWGVVFILSMVILVKAADYFIESSEIIGLAMGFPAFVVGITLVAFGTSLPELVSSLIATARGLNEFAVANTIGSNIANLLLVIGLSAIIGKRLKVEFDILKVDLPLLLGGTTLLTLTLYDGVFTMIEGFLCFTLFLIYLAYSLSIRRLDIPKEKKKIAWWVIPLFIGSAVGIFIGSHFTVESVIRLSGLFGFNNTAVIAISAVALGTSLPELFVSVAAVRKGNMEIAIGNVLGSNMFNMGLVLGIPSFVTTLIAPPAVMTGLMFLVGATAMYLFASMDKEITSFEGAMLIVLYVLFITKLFV